MKFDESLLKADIFLRGWERGVAIVNPAGWFGRAMALVIEGGYTPLYLVVEAGCYADALDEVVDSPAWGHHLRIPEADLAGYREHEIDYGGNNGVPCRFDNVNTVVRSASKDVPHPILYTHPDWEVLKHMTPLAYYDFCNILSFEDTLYWVHKHVPEHRGETEVNEAMGLVDIVRGGDKGEAIEVEDAYPEIHRQFLRAQAKKP